MLTFRKRYRHRSESDIDTKSAKMLRRANAPECRRTSILHQVTHGCFHNPQLARNL